MLRVLDGAIYAGRNKRDNEKNLYFIAGLELLMVMQHT